MIVQITEGKSTEFHVVLLHSVSGYKKGLILCGLC